MFLSNSLFSNFYGRLVYLGCFGPKQKLAVLVGQFARVMLGYLFQNFDSTHNLVELH